MNKTYQAQTQEDENGDCILEFPTHMMEELGWIEGDILDLDYWDNSICVINKSRLERNP